MIIFFLFLTRLRTMRSTRTDTLFLHTPRFRSLGLRMPGIISLLLVDSWNDYDAVKVVTEEVYDSALLEPAKVLETSVEFNHDGSLRIDPPFYAQVMLESRAGNRKYFRVEIGRAHV